MSSEITRQSSLSGDLDSIVGFDKFFKNWVEDMYKYIRIIKENEVRIKKISVNGVSETFSKATSSIKMGDGEAGDKDERS